MTTTSAATRLASRYKGKKELDSGNTVYEYSKEQIARRNGDKARRLEKLRGNVGKLRAQVKKDLNSGDPNKVLTALAVGLMDHTAERVGNPSSAKDGHFGVTGWQKKHVSFSGSKASVSYVGKSGVKQKKTITDKALISALKDAHAACEDGDLFCHDMGTVDAGSVNTYLKKFGITAKDLRGLHANQVMQQKLKAVRKGGLPSDPKEKEAQLKKEFQEALEETAKDVGHEASTLRSQYLVPNLEDEFMKGRVMNKMVKNAASRRVADMDSVTARYLARRRVVARYLEAGQFEAPPAMHSAIMTWIEQVLAANGVQRAEEKVEKAKGRPEYRKGLTDLLAAAKEFQKTCSREVAQSCV